MTPHQKEFLKCLDEMTTLEGMRQFEAMATFLELGFRSLVSVTLFGEAHEANEKAYLERVGKFRHKTETTTACARALAHVVEGLEQDGRDFLADPFMEVAGSAFAGQFFTPYDVSKMMAMLSIDASVAEIAKFKIVTLQEPACGVGGMALAAAEVLKSHGVDPARRAHFTLIDIDINCVRGAYMQTTLAGISADVIHGNTLLLETWGGWRTFAAATFPKNTRGARIDELIEVLAAGEPPQAALEAPSPIEPPTLPRPASKPMQLTFADF